MKKIYEFNFVDESQILLIRHDDYYIVLYNPINSLLPDFEIVFTGYEEDMSAKEVIKMLTDIEDSDFVLTPMDANEDECIKSIKETFSNMLHGGTFKWKRCPGEEKDNWHCEEYGCPKDYKPCYWVVE